MFDCANLTLISDVDQDSVSFTKKIPNFGQMNLPTLISRRNPFPISEVMVVLFLFSKF